MKVAINNCYGGFNLSDKAFELLLDRKGVEYEKVESRYSDIWLYYEKGHVRDDNFFISHDDYYSDRADPDLIEIIEELGENANGYSSSLKIVNIPEGIEWHVYSYDGLEHIAENHRIWG